MACHLINKIETHETYIVYYLLLFVCTYLLIELPPSLLTPVIVSLYGNNCFPKFFLVDTAISANPKTSSIIGCIIYLWRIELAEHNAKLQALNKHDQKCVYITCTFVNIYAGWAADMVKLEGLFGNQSASLYQRAETD